MEIWQREMLHTGAVLEKGSLKCAPSPILRKVAWSLTCSQRMLSSWLNKKSEKQKCCELRNKQIYTQKSSH